MEFTHFWIIHRVAAFSGTNTVGKTTRKRTMLTVSLCQE